jgi:hypothetical protein
VTGLTASIDDLQQRATNATDTIRTIVTLATIAITLLLVWILILNVALWQLGEIWRREAAANTTEATARSDAAAS